MQSSKNEQAGFGRGERKRNRFQVAHLADEDNVRILSKRGFQRHRERFRIAGHFALGDDASLVVVHELDRFLDSDDVPRENSR